MGKKSRLNRLKKSKMQSSAASETSSAQVGASVLGSTNLSASGSRNPVVGASEQSSSSNNVRISEKSPSASDSVVALNPSAAGTASESTDSLVASSEQSSSQVDEGQEEDQIILSECIAVLTEYQRGNESTGFNLINKALDKHSESGLLHSVRAWMCRDICSKNNDSDIHAKYFDHFMESANKAFQYYPNAIGYVLLFACHLLCGSKSIEDYRMVCKACRDALEEENPTDLLPESLMAIFPSAQRISQVRSQLGIVMESAKLEIRRRVEANVAAAREKQKKQDAQQSPKNGTPADLKKMVTNEEVSGAQDGQRKAAEASVAAARHKQKKQDAQQTPKSGTPADTKKMVNKEEVSGAKDGQRKDVEANVAAARHKQKKQDAQQPPKSGTPKKMVTNEEVSGTQDGQRKAAEANVAAAREKQKKQDAQQPPKNGTPKKMVTNEEVSSEQDGQRKDVGVNVAAARHKQKKQDAQQSPKHGSTTSKTAGPKKTVKGEEVSGLEVSVAAEDKDGQRKEVKQEPHSASHEAEHDITTEFVDPKPADQIDIVGNEVVANMEPQPAGQNNIVANEVVANVEPEAAGQNNIVANEAIENVWVPWDDGIATGLTNSREVIAQIIHNRLYAPTGRRRLEVFRSIVPDEDP